MTPRMLRRAALAAAVAVLVTVSGADAQTTGSSGGQPTLRPFPKSGGSGGGTTGGSTGGTTGVGGSTGGRTGGRGFGFGQRATLTQEEELAVLLDTLSTVEAILDSGEVQVRSEFEILMLLFVVYESKRAEALALAQGGTGTGGITIPGLGGTTGSGTTTSP